MKLFRPIIKDFRKCLNTLNEIPNINWGGCGISALSMHRWLKMKNYLMGDEKFYFLYQKNDPVHVENNLIINHNKNGQLQAPAHVVFYFMGDYFDSGGKQNKMVVDKHEYYPEHRHPVTLIELIDAINNIDSWCHDFDRIQSIPDIEKELKIDLSDILISNKIKKEEEKIWTYGFI